MFLYFTYPYIYAYDVTGVEDAAVPAWLETIQGLRYLVDCNAHAAIVMPSKDKKYFGDIIVHVFDRENRQFYNLERIWKDGHHVSVEDLEA